MSAGAAVGIDDDFASGESAITVGSADFKEACWVEVDGDVVGPPVGTEDGFEDVFDAELFEFGLSCG